MVEHDLTRQLLYYPTGQGKSKNALGLAYARGYEKLVVLAPPRTYDSWQKDANVLGLSITLHSHQKFRMPDTKYPRGTTFIVDEFHLLGGHGAAGFKKLNRMAATSDMPIIAASATPEYNDAERVFCLTAIMDRVPNRNFLDWLYKNCETRPNPFATTPYVDGFLNYDNAGDFLSSQQWTTYVPDSAEWTVYPLELDLPDLTVFEDYGFSERHFRIMASRMEKNHKRVDLQLLDDRGVLRKEVERKMLWNMQRHNRDRWMIFASHETIAVGTYAALRKLGLEVFLITGKLTNAMSLRQKAAFLQSKKGILIGTASLATGVDGIDKVCQSMVILDDVVGDNSLRRQLIGRILPRGEDDGIERIVLKATTK